MKPGQEIEDLELFLALRGEPLLRTAVLLAGTRESGEDLLQSALERLLRHWRKIEGSPEGYLRATLYYLAADGWRRQRAWRKQARLLDAGQRGRPVDTISRVDLHDAAIRLLRQLPARQRAVIVGRYWEQLGRVS